MGALEKLLVRLFPRTVHQIVSRQVSQAYSARWIDSRAMHLMAEQSGFTCRRPGYHNPFRKP